MTAEEVAERPRCVLCGRRAGRTITVEKIDEPGRLGEAHRACLDDALRRAGLHDEPIGE